MVCSENYHDYLPKSTIIIICVCGLFYQLWPICQTYINGNTVVNIEVNVDFDYIPSFTLCYDKVFNLDSVKSYDSKIKKGYENLLSYIEQVSSNNYVYKNYENISEEKLINITKLYLELEMKANKLYRMKSQSNFDPRELFDNFTIQFHKDDDEETITLITIVNVINQRSVYYNTTIKPIESIIKNELLILYPIRKTFIGKCFTFFSDLKPNWKSYKSGKSNLIIYLKFPINWFQLSTKREVIFFMHSSNRMFEHLKFENYFILSPYSIHRFEYSKVEIRLYENSIMSNCKNYLPTQLSEIDNKNNINNVHCKHDCLLTCFMDSFTPQCEYTVLDKKSISIPRKYLYRRGKSPCKGKEFMGRLEICEKICKKECHSSYYIMNHHIIDEITNDHDMFKKVFGRKLKWAISFELVHNKYPDILITHLPEMPLIELICNFGGLLGMWLGISILSSCGDMLSLIKKIYIKMNNINLCQFNIINYNNYKMKFQTSDIFRRVH